MGQPVLGNTFTWGWKQQPTDLQAYQEQLFKNGSHQEHGGCEHKACDDVNRTMNGQDMIQG